MSSTARGNAASPVLVSANKDEISVVALESQRVESWMRGSHMIRDDPRPRVVLLRFTASLQVLPALLPPCHSTYKRSSPGSLSAQSSLVLGGN
jgi:hypothetical protein